MDFITLETYLVVADTLNITAAADRLFVSQSTVTQRLHRLEEELQYQLFTRERGKRKMELTWRGEEFLSIANRWIELYRETELLKDLYVGTVSIAALDSVICTILPSVLTEILNSNKLNLKMYTQHTREIYSLVKKREIDIGFVTRNTHDPELEVQKVISQKYYLIRPCRNPQGIKKVHPSELDPAYEIYESWGDDYVRWHNSWWSVITTPRINVDTVSALSFFLKMEDERYWSIVHTSALKSILKTCSVQIYELLDQPPEWSCYKVEHKDPRNKNLQGIVTFNRIFQKFCSETDLFAPIGDSLSSP